MQCSLSCPSWNIAVFQTLCSWQVPCAVATVYWQKTTILMLHTMRWCMPDTLHLSTAKFCLLGMVAAICINNHVTTYISNASVNSMIFHQNMKCLQALDRSAFFLTDPIQWGLIICVDIASSGNINTSQVAARFDITQAFWPKGKNTALTYAQTSASQHTNKWAQQRANHKDAHAWRHASTKTRQHKRAQP